MGIRQVGDTNESVIDTLNERESGSQSKVSSEDTQNMVAVISEKKMRNSNLSRKCQDLQ